MVIDIIWRVQILKSANRKHQRDSGRNWNSIWNSTYIKYRFELLPIWHYTMSLQFYRIPLCEVLEFFLLQSIRLRGNCWFSATYNVPIWAPTCASQKTTSPQQLANDSWWKSTVSQWSHKKIHFIYVSIMFSPPIDSSINPISRSAHI